MRTTILIVIGALGLAAAALVGIQAFSKQESSPVSAVAVQPLVEPATPADRQIRLAEARIKSLPAMPEGYNLLAAAYLRKARETGDFGFNGRAEAALKRSLEIAPKDQTALTLRATLLLTNHRFREALDEAKRAQEAGPESPDLYGVMTDALVELGEYQDAVNMAQKMMNLRPDSASYSRASYLRFLHGDLEGAIEAMRVAVKAANPSNPENAGWFRVRLGLELMMAGRREEGEQEFDIALEIFPDYYLALEAKAKARAAAGDFQKAIEFYRQAQQRVPLPDTAIALGDLYRKLGRTEDAKTQYELFEFLERSQAESTTYSSEFALFWANHDTKLDEALEIMRRERSGRADIYTLDGLAWCLYKKGQLAEAREAIEQATRLGTRDALIDYHAGMIYAASGDRRRAAKYLTLALETDPSFDVLQAEVAKQKLEGIKASMRSKKWLSVS